MTEEEFRTRLVDEARSWLGTPYHHGACVKGVGADCATFLFGVFRNLGLVSEDEEGVGVFSRDWFCHAHKETYLFRALRHAYKTAEAIAYRSLDAKPGCIVLTRVAGSRVYNHGGIVTRWPRVAHAIQPQVGEIDASRDPMWAYHQVVILDPFLKTQDLNVR